MHRIRSTYHVTRPTQTGILYGGNNAGYIDLILARRRRTIELAQSQTDETSDLGTRREVAGATAWPQSVRRRLVHTDDEKDCRAVYGIVYSAPVPRCCCHGGI